MIKARQWFFVIVSVIGIGYLIYCCWPCKKAKKLRGKPQDGKNIFDKRLSRAEDMFENAISEKDPALMESKKKVEKELAKKRAAANWRKLAEKGVASRKTAKGNRNKIEKTVFEDHQGKTTEELKELVAKEKLEEKRHDVPVRQDSLDKTREKTLDKLKKETSGSERLPISQNQEKTEGKQTVWDELTDQLQTVLDEIKKKEEDKEFDDILFGGDMELSNPNVERSIKIEKNSNDKNIFDKRLSRAEDMFENAISEKGPALMESKKKVEKELNDLLFAENTELTTPQLEKSIKIEKANDNDNNNGSLGGLLFDNDTLKSNPSSLESSGRWVGGDNKVNKKLFGIDTNSDISSIDREYQYWNDLNLDKLIPFDFDLEEKGRSNSEAKKDDLSEKTGSNSSTTSTGGGKDDNVLTNSGVIDHSQSDLFDMHSQTFDGIPASRIEEELSDLPDIPLIQRWKKKEIARQQLDDFEKNIQQSLRDGRDEFVLNSNY